MCSSPGVGLCALACPCSSAPGCSCHHAMFMGRVEKVDPPAGSGSLLSPPGCSAAPLYLGAPERQGTLQPNTCLLATPEERLTRVFGLVL